MENHRIEPFNLIGIAVRTTNENEQAQKDLTLLWQRFMDENIREKVPNIVDETVYCVYTDFESDHTAPYTAIIGYKVSTLDEIPEGMREEEVSGGAFKKFTATGKYADHFIGDTWRRIWKTDLPRTYQHDIEVYGEQSKDPENATVDIFVGVE